MRCIRRARGLQSRISPPRIFVQFEMCKLILDLFWHLGHDSVKMYQHCYGLRIHSPILTVAGLERPTRAYKSHLFLPGKRSPPGASADADRDGSPCEEERRIWELLVKYSAWSFVFLDSDTRIDATSRNDQIQSQSSYARNMQRCEYNQQAGLPAGGEGLIGTARIESSQNHHLTRSSVQCGCAQSHFCWSVSVSQLLRKEHHVQDKFRSHR